MCPEKAKAKEDSKAKVKEDSRAKVKAKEDHAASAAGKPDKVAPNDFLHLKMVLPISIYYSRRRLRARRRPGAPTTRRRG